MCSQAALCQTDYTTEVGSGSGSVTELYTAFGTAVDGAVTEDAANALFTGSASASGSGPDSGSGVDSTASGSTEVNSTSTGPGQQAALLDKVLLPDVNETREALAHEGSEQSSVRTSQSVLPTESRCISLVRCYLRSRGRIGIWISQCLLKGTLPSDRVGSGGHTGGSPFWPL